MVYATLTHFHQELVKFLIPKAKRHFNAEVLEHFKLLTKDYLFALCNYNLKPFQSLNLNISDLLITVDYWVLIIDILHYVLQGYQVPFDIHISLIFLCDLQKRAF